MNLHLHPHRWNLIVNADDLGAHPARDAAILELAAAGRVSSASLLVNATHSAAARAAQMIGLPLEHPAGASPETNPEKDFHAEISHDAAAAAPLFAAQGILWPDALFEIEPPCPAHAESEPRFLILSKLDASTGNHTTALALKARLASHGSVLLHPLADGVPDVDVCIRLAVRELDALLRRERIDFILGIQARRCGELLRRLHAAGGPDIPYALLFSGTDANEDLADPARSTTIGVSLAAAGCSFALSAAMADAVSRRFPELPRPRVITADGEIATASDYRLREHHGLPPTARILLLPAGIRPVKDILLALDALTGFLSERPDYLLLILGPVLDTAYHARCRARRDAIVSAQPHLTGRLLIEPGLPRADYLAALRQSDYLINTSTSEGRPNAVLEAMGCSVPVIARDIVGNRQFVRDGESGLLFTDAATLAAACRRLTGDPDLCKRLVSGGRNEYARQYAAHLATHDNDALLTAIEAAMSAWNSRL
jgi:glycosyltransferase involved in cell wall biosynthesis